VLAIVGAASFALALSACGSSGSDDVKGASSGSSAPVGSVSSAPSPSASSGSGPAACAAADLKGAVKTLGGAAGTAYYALQVTNQGGSACSLGGFDTVTLRTAGGDRIGAAARNQGRAKAVVLQPGQSASRRLGVGTAVNYPTSKCRPKASTAVAISSRTPAETVTAPLKTQGCASTTVKLMVVQPFHAAR